MKRITLYTQVRRAEGTITLNLKHLQTLVDVCRLQWISLAVTKSSSLSLINILVNTLSSGTSSQSGTSGKSPVRMFAQGCGYCKSQYLEQVLWRHPWIPLLPMNLDVDLRRYVSMALQGEGGDTLTLPGSHVADDSARSKTQEGDSN